MFTSIRVLSLLVILGASQPAQAQVSDLAQSIVEAGTTVTADRTTGIKIQGCEVTTVVHQPYKDQGWVLHSRFVFDLSYTNIELFDKKSNKYFFYDAGLGLAIISFKTLSPYKATHEMPNYRKPKSPSVPSTRKGADGYVFIENTSFVVILEGLESPDKPEMLAQGLRKYKSEFCSPVS